jgi:hypothetical protein
VKHIKQASGIQTLGGDYHKCESTFRPRTVVNDRTVAGKSKQKQRAKSKKQLDGKR